MMKWRSHPYLYFLDRMGRKGQHCGAAAGRERTKRSESLRILAGAIECLL